MIQDIPTPDQAGQEPSDEFKVKIGERLKQILEAAKATRASFIETGDEINKYAYDKDYNFLYQNWETQNGELFFKAKVAKAAQFVDIIGPYIYQYNPTYRVSPKAFAYPECVQRNKWEEQYLNWSAHETDLYTQNTRCVNESLIYGRGVVWTGYNPRKKCVQHQFDTIKNLFVDPDATCWDDVNIIFRKRIKPRWEVIQNYPKSKKDIGELQKSNDLPSQLKQTAGSGANGPSDLIVYYEAYARIGIGRFMSDAEGEIDDSPMKYVFTEAGKIIDILPWEIPFWRDDLWPVEPLDLRELPGHVWPAAPMQPGLGFMKALNWIHTLYLSKMQVTTRTALIIFNRNGNKIEKDEVFKLIRGDQMDTIQVTVNGNEDYDINKMVQQFKFDTGVAELERFNSVIGGEFDKATGLYSLLYAGQTDTQIRTAEDAKMKDRNSRNRIDHMKVQVEKFATKLGRKNRFAARFLETPDDIGRIFGPQAGQEWGYLADPQEVAQARQAQQQQAQAGYPPDQIPPVEAVDFDQWIMESDVDVESGSMRRADVDQAVDAADRAMNQAVPALMSSGDKPAAYEIMKAWAQINNMPSSVQEALGQAQQNAVQQQQMMQQQQAMQMQMQAQQQPPQQPQPPQGA